MEIKFRRRVSEKIMSYEIIENMILLLNDLIIRSKSISVRKFCAEADRSNVSSIMKIILNDFHGTLITMTSSEVVHGYDIVYHIQLSCESRFSYVIFNLHVFVSDEDLVIPSISRIFKSALWSEREIAEKTGINFIGHLDPRNLTLPEHWEKIDTFSSKSKSEDRINIKPIITESDNEIF